MTHSTFERPCLGPSELQLMISEMDSSVSFRGRKSSLLKLKYLSKKDASWRTVSASPSKDEPGIIKC